MALHVVIVSGDALVDETRNKKWLGWVSHLHECGTQESMCAW